MMSTMTPKQWPSKGRIEQLAREAGRWDEYKNLREQYRIQLKADGVDRLTAARDAGRNAWTDLQNGEKPIPTGSGERWFDDTLDLVDAERFLSDKGTAKANIAWVAQKLRVEVEPEQCPCPEAWGLLQWARHGRNEDAFWTKLYPMLLPPKGLEDEGLAAEKEAERIETVIAEVEKAARAGTLDEAADAPEEEDDGA